MKDRVNTYFAMSMMFIAGALAMWVIIHAATITTSVPTVVGGSEASYSSLKQSILKQ